MKKIIMLLLCSFSSEVSSGNCQTGNVYSDIDCYEKERKLLIRSLNKQYDELKKIDNNGIVLSEFEKSQMLWNKFIEADCQFMNAPMSEAQGAGSVLVYHSCIVERFEQRNKQLESILIDLKSNK